MNRSRLLRHALFSAPFAVLVIGVAGGASCGGGGKARPHDGLLPHPGHSDGDDLRPDDEGPAEDPAETLVAPAAASWTDADLEFCVAETNRYRAQHGKKSVKRSAVLEKCAREGADHDHAVRMAHDHFAQTAGCNISFAENEIPWWPLDYAGGTARGTIEVGLKMMYDEGPGGGHHDNMLGEYTELGCGIHVEAGEITVVQNFR